VPLALTDAAIFRRKRTVAMKDVDELDHVNNVVWVRYVIQLAFAHAEALGFHFEEDKRSGHVWVVRRHEIDYHRSAALGAEITEETWVSELHGARLVRHSRFSLGNSDSLLASARTVWAWVELATMRPKRVPREIVERFPILP
jgi:acyl-CoA thioester hydrolase